MLAVAADAGVDLPFTLTAGCLPLDTPAGVGVFCVVVGAGEEAEGREATESVL